MMNNESALTLLYDGQCPLCTFGANRLQKTIKNIPFTCIDARQDSTLRQEATRAGIDLDEGVAIRLNGKLYHRYDAIHLLAPHCAKPDIFTLLYKLFFTNATMTRLLFPLVRGARKVLLRLRGRPPISNLATDTQRRAFAPEPSKIRERMGAAYLDLHPNVQARFAHDPAIGTTLDYKGLMDVTYCSPAGKCFALLTRLIGNPLLPLNGLNVPMDVKLMRHPGHDGIFWQRTYHYPDLPAISVVSAKKMDAKGDLMECVGGGFGMKLRLEAENGELHFISDYYFFHLGSWRLPLPHVISPGKTCVTHKDIGQGRFRYSITMTHPWLGVTFFQTGVFREA